MNYPRADWERREIGEQVCWRCPYCKREIRLHIESTLKPIYDDASVHGHRCPGPLLAEWESQRQRQGEG